MALIKVPPTTLNRGSLANASRIIKLNMIDQGFAQPLIDAMPVLVPYRKSVSNYFLQLEAAFFARLSGAGYIPFAIPNFYRNDINKQIKRANFNFWYMSGAPLPDTPPILVTPIEDMTGQSGVAFNDIAADTSDNWASSPTTFVTTQLPEGMTFIDGVFGGTPTGFSGSYNPLVTATNAFGSTNSNVFNITIAGA